MQNPLRITAVQSNIVWENRAENLRRLDAMSGLRNTTDIIVLPEMFTTGFTMQPEVFAESPDGDAIAWMRRLAADTEALVIGSLSMRVGQQFYNRLHAVFPSGEYVGYDKVHLFSFGNEPAQYTSGSSRHLVDWKGWRILPLICYDLRFPELARNTFEQPYDVLLYVANWPAVRSYPWSTLLRARAIENQSYVVGVNRVGTDGNGIDHSGDSVVLDPRGAILAAGEPGKEEVFHAVLDPHDLADFRAKFPVLKDYKFTEPPR
ncbi:MAG: hypothetical protein RL226_1612 [Bacteroidota bacterium]|jgi:predicted amidohydrolase